MLVLSRKLYESFFIGDDIEITVVGIRGNKVRIGIKAPDDADHRIVRPEAKNKEPRPKGES